MSFKDAFTMPKRENYIKNKTVNENRLVEEDSQFEDDMTLSELKPTLTINLPHATISGTLKTLTNNLYIHQMKDGLIYLNSNKDVPLRLINYEWSGPLYNTISTSNTTENNEGKTKRKGRVIGAVVGTALLPGVGTVIGAAHGTGNKKHKGKTQAKTTTSQTQVEIPAAAILQLENINTKEIAVISCNIKSELNAQLLSLKCIEEKYVPENDDTINDPYENLKKLKELLDMDIITQEEFDKKKKELLGL